MVKTKQMAFVDGKAVKLIPTNVRILHVTDGDIKLPHRVVDKKLEVKSKFTGSATVTWERVELAHAAAMYPLA